MNPTLRQTIQTKNLIVGLNHEFIYIEEMKKEKSLLSSISDSGKEEALYQALTYIRSTSFL